MFLLILSYLLMIIGAITGYFGGKIYVRITSIELTPMVNLVIKIIGFIILLIGVLLILNVK